MKNRKRLAELFGILSQEAEKTAKTLQEISDCMEEVDRAEEKAPGEEPAADPKKKQEETEPAEVDEKVGGNRKDEAQDASSEKGEAEPSDKKAEESVGKDTIHDLMVKLTLAKKTEQVKAILSDYAPRLSQVQEKDFPELYRRLRELEGK